VLEPGSQLRALVREVVQSAKERVEGLWEMGETERATSGGKVDEGEEQGRELHISLSRPVYLRAHQREDFKRAVKSIAKRFSSFKASFARLSQLTNDERTRTFLTMEIGAGHLEFQALVDALVPILQSIRQETYYEEPRFHASIAWVLVAPSDQCSGNGSPSPAITSSTPQSEPCRCGVQDLPVEALNDQYGKLIASHVGQFDVDGVWVKIGKDVAVWRLDG